jgi:hypothetical protein
MSRLVHGCCKDDVRATGTDASVLSKQIGTSVIMKDACTETILLFILCSKVPRYDCSQHAISVHFYRGDTVLEDTILENI